MITRDDCMSILVDMENDGTNIDKYLTMLLTAREIPTDVLKFIQDKRGIEVANFYEMLRKKYNQKKSPLYKNLVSIDDDVTSEAITTLVCLLTQITLYSNKLDQVQRALFLTEVRAEEIARVIHDYFMSNDLYKVSMLLKLIKADILVLEYISGHREKS